jgi:hypothetical protein
VSHLRAEATESKPVLALPESPFLKRHGSHPWVCEGCAERIPSGIEHACRAYDNLERVRLVRSRVLWWKSEMEAGNLTGTSFRAMVVDLEQALT